MNVSEVVTTIVNVLAILAVLLPPAIQITQAVAQKTHNIRLTNLSDRANIIVQAMEQSGLSNDQKKQEAMTKLAQYSKEAGIPVTSDQLSDYIEAAVKFMKLAIK